MLEKLIRVIQESTECEMEIYEDSMLVEDLGLSSIEIMVLIGDIEDAFDVKIKASQLRNVRTVGELLNIIE